MSPPGARKLSPSTWSSGRPSATSRQVWSNSSRVTKSIAFDARSDCSGRIATCGPTKPISSFGFTSFSASAVRTSEWNEGVLVCRKQTSKSRASGSTCSSVMSAGGASTSLLPGTIAAGCASQVGYQNERTSRRAW